MPGPYCRGGGLCVPEATLREALKVLDGVTNLSVSPKGGYNYKLTLPEGGGAWRMHWHPGGGSDVEFAHLHLPPDFRRHLASERMPLEKAIQWCAQHDAPLTCDPDEAANRLMMIEAPHRLHRSWV